MSRLQKKESLKEARRRLIIDTAFRIFVEQKIEPVSMGEIASAAGIGRATLFRYYANEYYGAAEPPVRCGESHLSGLTEPPHFVY